MDSSLLPNGDTKLQKVLEAVLREYRLPADGVHGVKHWMRVMENGMRLARLTGANETVVRLFALLHDSKRLNDGWDPGHGKRGAAFAAELRGKLFELSDEEFDLLSEACSHHTDGLTEADITVQTCWDADRLDLWRVGITPRREKLCTEEARGMARSSPTSWCNTVSACKSENHTM